MINESPDPTAIHWHGLRQQSSIEMDGVPGVTQCPILPNKSYVYRFSTKDQVGTFWYHSHHAMQYADGLKGVLIIQDPADPWQTFYDDEEILQLTDWYHQPAQITLIPYINPGIPDPIADTGLINGIGQFKCSPLKNCSYYRASIRQNTTKRFRIINTSAYATITLTIDQHAMRVIEADGIYLDGQTIVRSLRLSAGQRYSVLVTSLSDHVSSYWIRATLHSTADFNGLYIAPIQPNVSAILHYVTDSLNINEPLIIPSIETFNNDNDLIEKSFKESEISIDQDDLVVMNIHENKLVQSSQVKTFLFNGNFLPGNQPGFLYNNTMFVHPGNRTLLSSVLADNEHEIRSPIHNFIERGDVIDIIINNIDYGSHPMHLHGHHVWILALGKANEGYINATTSEYLNYNLVNPMYRDTFTVNPFSYVVFRFVADNPGIWMMHCHNDWHLQIGMAMVFIESSQAIKQMYQKQSTIESVFSICPSLHH